MELFINYWAVLLCAVANMVLGSMWFGPLFGKKWMALSGKTRESAGSDTKKMQKTMIVSYGLMFAGSLVMATILSWAIILANAFFGLPGAALGMVVGVLVWIGFVLPITMGVVLWEGKSWTYWAITYFYYLAALLMMGAILGAWMGFGPRYTVEHRLSVERMQVGNMMEDSRDVYDTNRGMNMQGDMDAMMSGLAGKTGDDFDRAFLSEMIIHHQGAVDMAKAALQYSQHTEIKNLAQSIITAQEKEIADMQAWQKSWWGI